MASTVLPNGIIIPEKYSRDWYADLYHNWQELDNLLGGGTPKDGTLTIQKNGDTVGTFSANQATDETIDITVPDVNDATLTIQKNGTDVATFSANSSTNATANITVPTKTSDLTNDSGFITEDTTKIPLAGSNAISGDLIPSTDGTVNLGGSSYQWNNAYIKSLTINGVVCGDILTHNVSEFVNVSSNQTIGGVKTFSSSPRITKTFPEIALNISDCDVTETPTEAKSATLYFRDKNNKVLSYVVSQLRTNGTKRICLRTHRTDNINNYYSVDLDSSGDFYPEQNNAINLGNSTLKWKSFNGLNPGALSLPSTNLINVASSITSLDGTTTNTLTPQVDGWLLINGVGAENDGFIYVVQGRIGTKSTNGTTSLECAVLIPVVAGVQVSVTCKLNTLTWANIAPCQGNV